jgi:hypothetical protein
MGDARELVGTVSFVDSQAVANADLAALRGDKAAPCIEQLFLRQLTRGQAVLPRVLVSHVTPPTAAPDVVAIRLQTTVRASGQDLPVFVDIVSAIKGRAEVQATFQDVNHPVEASLQRQAMEVMLARL